MLAPCIHGLLRLASSGALWQSAKIKIQIASIKSNASAMRLDSKVNALPKGDETFSGEKVSSPLGKAFFYE